MRVATSSVDGTAQRALRQRLRTAADVLLEMPPNDPDPNLDTGTIFDALVTTVHRSLDRDQMWLLWTAVASAFPSADELRGALRSFELTDANAAGMLLLDACLEAAHRCGSPELGMELISGRVVVDVDYSARHELHTGIQRVVRTVLPRWNQAHDIVPVVWTNSRGMLRTLTDDEARRVLAWPEHHSSLRGAARVTASDSVPSTLLVPWRSVLVLVEVSDAEVSDRLAALARYSGNDVVAIGYDCIPIVSADMVPLVEPNRFVKYLTVIKHARRIAGISISAAEEFQGFANMLPVQGVVGPSIIECALPVEVATELPAQSTTGDPLVLCVGSFEPRKNQLAVLYAAEALWREGLRFRLRFIGGGGWDTQFRRRVRQLRHAGYPVAADTAVSDDELIRAYREARFSVFVSTHEGYGLPVTESLALGTPVITSDYGSTREVGRDGGTILVDPREDEEVRVAMRRLLVDDELRDQLLVELQKREPRTWDDYASELWSSLVLPCLTPTAGDP